MGDPCACGCGFPARVGRRYIEGHKKRPQVAGLCACGCGARIPPGRKVAVGHGGRRPVAERFWEKVEKTDTCWLWRGCLVQGYGKLGLFVEGKRTIASAHRLAWELTNGPIPQGFQIDHVCKNTRCVRPHPDHLEPVLPLVNAYRSRGLAAVNGGKMFCPHGHQYTPENTYFYTYNGTVRRSCRECRRVRSNLAYHRKRGHLGRAA